MILYFMFNLSTRYIYKYKGYACPKYVSVREISRYRYIRVATFDYSITVLLSVKFMGHLSIDHMIKCHQKQQISYRIIDLAL